MDTSDVSALAQRIQELEKENARLKAILDKNGIEYKNLEQRTCDPNYVETAPVSICQFTLLEKVAIFQNLFQGRDFRQNKSWTEYQCVIQRRTSGRTAKGYRSFCRT